jgi:hypothetical protein
LQVEIHIEFSPGVWRCREVPIGVDQVVEQGDREVRIKLGRIKVDFDACREPKGWGEDEELCFRFQEWSDPNPSRRRGRSRSRWEECPTSVTTPLRLESVDGLRIDSIRSAIQPVARPTAQVRHSCVASTPARFSESRAFDHRMPSQYPTRR